MGFLDQLLEGVGGTLAGIGQGLMPAPPPRQDPMRPRRRPRPDYRPQEQETFSLIAQALEMGLDPSIADQMMGGMAEDLDARIAQYQAKNAQRKEMMQSVLPQVTSQAAEMYAAGVPANAIQTAMSGYGGKVGQRVDQFIGQLGAGGGATGLPPEDAEGIYADAVAAAEKGMPLHQARLLIIGKLRAMNYPEDAIVAAQNAIGSAYSAAAPDLIGSAPVTMTPPSAAPRVTPADVAGIGGTAQTGTGYPYMGPVDPVTGEPVTQEQRYRSRFGIGI